MLALVLSLLLGLGNPSPGPQSATSAQSQPTGPQGGCAAALAYLDTHMASGWRAVCPGYASGHEAMTCWDIPGFCPGYDNKVVVIAIPCPASWENEAHNTWVFYDQGYYASGPWDGYGYC